MSKEIIREMINPYDMFPAQPAHAVVGKGAYKTREFQSAVDKKVNKIVNKKVSGKGAYRMYSGQGDYNALFPDHTQQVVGGMVSAKSDLGACSLCREEFIGNIYSPTTPANFTNTSYAVNPGLNVFPWLSQIAGNFRKYRFKQLIFTFKPSISTASTTGAMGNIIMAMDYNAGSNKFATSQQMQEYAGSITAVPYKQIVCGIECDPKQLEILASYVRTGAVPAGQDVKTYDWGLFQIATDGIPAAVFPAGTLLGKLYVYYDIELSIPQYWEGLGYSIATDTFTGTTGCTAILPFGTAPLKSGQNTIGGTMTKTGVSTYTFPDNFSGTVRVCVYGTSSSTASFMVITPTGQYTNYAAIGGNLVSLSAGAATASTTNCAIFYYTWRQATIAGGNTLTFSYGNDTVTSCWLEVAECNSLNGQPYGPTSNYVAA